MSLNARESSPYAVLRNPNFALYLIGRFIASFGQQMLTVAVGWELYERTHSSLSLGLVGLMQFLPMVLMTLPAGHIADTRNRKHVIIAMQALLVLATLGLALISIFQESVSWVYCCLFASGLARTFLWSASASFMPQLVSREQFPRAVAWSANSFQFSAVAGPAVGGGLIALTHHAATIYLLNAVASAVCLILICFVRSPHKPVVKTDFSLAGLLGGFHFVFKTKVILGAVTLDMFAVLFGGATALLPVYAKDILHVGPSGLGLLEAALPVGSLVCGLYMAHRPPLLKAGRALLLGVAIFGLATIGFGFSKSFPLSWLMLFLGGFADNISVVVRHTLVQLLTPDAMRGRVSAVNNLFIGTSNELGGFESGLVSNFFGPVVSVVSGGIATILVVIGIAAKWPKLR
ncbi:MAG: MFS transporter, partial [Verrucomicrobiota bacterium]